MGDTGGDPKKKDRDHAGRGLSFSVEQGRGVQTDC